MSTYTPHEIQSIDDIVRLAQDGFDNWQQYGHVNVRERGDLRLFCYTTGAFIANEWNFFERVSRGLVINAATGEVVARPFDKFFYWLANGRKIGGHIVTITEKVDGSLGILYRHKDEYHITTKGSFFSPQARWATAHLRDNYDLSDLSDEWTLLFEIVYPENRIIIDYGAREDLVLLAARNRYTGEYMPFFPDLYTFAQEHGFSLPQVYRFNSVDDLIAATGRDTLDLEGWVAAFSTGERVKFKIDRYVEIHQYLRRLDFAHVLYLFRTGDIDAVLRMVPDDFLGDVYEWVALIEQRVEAISSQVVNAFVDAPRTSHAAFETYARTEHPELVPYLLAMWEGRDIEPLIYQRAFDEEPQSAE